MSTLAPETPRPLGPSDAVPDAFVVPYYREDVKRRISVARIDGRLYAFDDLCTCGGQPCPLSGGLLSGTTLMCQCHGSRFDITTGAVLNGPATEPLHRYEVREVDGDIQLRAAMSSWPRSIGASESVGASFDAAVVSSHR